jgi:hypothetical protein
MSCHRSQSVSGPDASRYASLVGFQLNNQLLEMTAHVHLKNTGEIGEMSINEAFEDW